MSRFLRSLDEVASLCSAPDGVYFIPLGAHPPQNEYASYKDLLECEKVIMKLNGAAAASGRRAVPVFVLTAIY